MLYGVQFSYIQRNSQEKISEITIYLKQSKDLRLNAKGSNETEDELFNSYLTMRNSSQFKGREKSY